MRNQKGFTLIELIMVIVILGILAAVVVPKFFDFTTDAHKASVESVVGTLKSGLEIYAADQIVNNGYKKYIKGSSLALATVLDQVPDNWALQDASGDKVNIVYTGDSNFGSGVKVEYDCSGDAGDGYTLTLKTAAYGWSVGKTF